MGSLWQFLLLIKKNFILRLRQPGVLLLEVVWPILIIGIIALIRLGVPPTKSDSCHYQERAMPSAGIVPFLQTFICNMDNQCHSPYTLNRAKETTYTVSKLVQDLGPTIASDNILEGLKSMDDAVRMMEGLATIANDTDLLSGLDDMLKVKSFFKDPEYVRRVLVDQYKVMTNAEVAAMLDSTVNVSMVFDLLGYPNFRGVACNPDELKKYLFFKEETDVKQVSSALCNISVDMIPEITTFLQNQFDVGELVRTIGKFAKLKKRLGQNDIPFQVFNDIADMIDLALKSPSLAKQLMSLSSLKKLPDLIRLLPEIINTWKSKFFDLSPFVKLVDILDPVIEETNPNDTIWYLVKYGVYVASDLSDLIQMEHTEPASVVISRILETAQKMADGIESLSSTMGPEIKLFLGALMEIDWTNIYDQILNRTLDTVGTVRNLQKLESALRQMPEVWNKAAPYIMVVNRFLQMGNILLEETNSLENMLAGIVNKIGPLQTALTDLFNKGPNVTLAVLSEFTNSRTLAKFFESKFSFVTLCNEVLNDVSKLNVDVSDLRVVMCSKDIDELVNTLAGSMRVQDIKNIMQDTVRQLEIYLNNGTVGQSANFTAIFFSVKNIIGTSENIVHIANATWQNLFSHFKVANFTSDRKRWEPVLDLLNENYMSSIFLGVIRGFGLAMEEGDLYKHIGKYVEMAEISLEYGYSMMKIYVDMYSAASPMGKFLTMATTYAPDMLESMAEMLKKPELIMQIVSEKDIPSVMCQWMTHMVLPPYAPKAELQKVICTDFPQVYRDLMKQPYLQQEMMTKIQTVMTSPPPTRQEVIQYWAGLNDYFERTVDMMSKPANIKAVMEGPVNLVSFMNFTQVGKAMSQMGEIMAGMTYKDISSMSSISLGVMGHLDMILTNVTEWRMVKHGVSAGNSFLKVIIKYFNEMNSTRSYEDLLDYYPVDLQKYINTMAAVTPDFLQALTKIVLNPEKLVQKLLSSPNGLAAPDCSSVWVTDFLDVETNSSLRELEHMTCTLNWTALAMDIAENNTDIREYTRQITMMMTTPMEYLPDVKVNWREVMTNVDHYMGIMSGQTAMWSAQNFNWKPFNMSAINMRWVDYVNALKSWQHFDMKKIGGLITQVQTYLETLARNYNTMNVTEIIGNDTVIGISTGNTLMLNSMYANLYIQHHFMTFLNKVMTYFTEHNPVVLLQMFGSEELGKLLKQMEMSPELTQIGFDAIVGYFMDPNRLSKIGISETFAMDLCTNSSFFREVFVIQDNQKAATVQEALCSSGQVNYTLLLEELKTNWDGFGEFYTAMELLSTDQAGQDKLRVNISELITDQMKFNDLLNKTMMKPPKIMLFASNAWLNATIYTKQWETFLDEMNTTLAKYGDPKYMANWQTESNRILISMLMSTPGAQEAFLIMDKILDIALPLVTKSDHYVSVKDVLKDYPSIAKMVELSNQLPEVFLVIGYTNLAHPDKSAMWTQAMQSWDKFCYSEVDQLFAVPPGVSFSMDDFVRELCSINIQQLQTELQTDKFEKILNSSGINLETVNATALSIKLAKFIGYLSNPMGPPMVINWNMQHLFNSSVWENTLWRFEQYANDSYSALFSSPAKIANFMTRTIFGSLMYVPGFDTALRYMDVILDIVKEQVQRSLQSLPDAYKGYPNMEKLVQLLDDIPAVIEVVIYTNQITPMKYQRWGMAVQSWDTFCATDANELFTIPPGSSINMNAIMQKICSVNVTALAIENGQIGGSDRLAKLMNSGNNTEPVNVTAVMMKLSDLMDFFLKLNATSFMQQQNQMNIFNETVWTSLFHRINKYVNQSVYSMSLSTLPDLIVGSIFQSMQAVPSWDKIVAIMDIVIDIMKDQIQRGLESLPEVYKGYPNMYSLVKLVDELPAVIEVISYTTLVDPIKIQRWSMVMQSWETFCTTDPDQLFSVPPGVKVNMSAIIHTICSVNVTALAIENQQINGGDKIAAVIINWNNNNTQPANATAVMKKLTDFIRYFMNLNATALMQQQQQLSIFNETVWTSMFNRVHQYANQSAYLSFSTLPKLLVESVFQSMQLVPGWDKIVTVMDLVTDIVKEQLQRGLKYLPDTYKGYPNMYSLVKLVDDIPALIEVITYTNFITPLKMQRWGMAMQSWETFCTTDPDQLFSVPPGVKVNMSAIIRTICSVNVTALGIENQQATGGDKIAALITNWNNTEPANATAVMTKMIDLIQSFMNLNITAFVQQQQQLSIFNETVWTSVFNRLHQYANQSVYATSLASLPKMLVESVFQSMQAVPGWDKIVAVMDVVIDIMKDQIQRGLESLPEAYKGYPNMYSLVKLVDDIPAVIEVITYTNLMTPLKMQRWGIAMQSWETFCTTDPDQLFSVPPGVKVNMSAIIHTICSVNVTALGIENQQISGGDKIAAVIANWNNNNTQPANATAVMKKLTDFIQYFMNLNATAFMQQQQQLSIFNETVWTSMFNRVHQYANQSVYATSLSSLPKMLVESVFQSMQAVPGWDKIVAVMDVVIDIMKDQIQRGLESLPEAYKGYPNMYSLVKLVDDIPAVIEVITYTNFITPLKMQRWGMAMQSWETFCITDPDQLFSVPPGVKVNMSAIISTICSVNVTALGIENQQISGGDKIAAVIANWNNNNTEPANATAVMKKLTDFIQYFMNLNTTAFMQQQQQLSIFNETVWTSMFHRITQYTNQTSYASSMASLDYMLSLYPDVRKQLSGMMTVVAVADMFMDRIIMLENYTSMNLHDIFPDSPELRKLMDMIQEPGVIQVLLDSVNSPKIQPLYMMANGTEIFTALCGPGGSVSRYLTVSPWVTVDLSQIQSDVCSVNISQLVKEVYAVFDVNRIERVAKGEKQVSFVAFNDKLTTAIKVIMKWTHQPPTLILPTNWENGTFWLNILESYSKTRQSPEVIAAEIDNFLKSMGPLLVQEPYRQYGLIIEKTLELVRENMIALQNQQLTLTTMFEKVPILRDIITALGLRSDILDTLMTFSVKDPVLYTRAMMSPNTVMCKSPDIWRKILVIPANYDTSALHAAICDHNATKIINNLVRNLDLGSVIDGLKNQSYIPDWMTMSKQTQELQNIITELVKNPPSFDVNETLSMLAEAYNQTNPWNIMAVYTVMAEMFGNSTEFQAVDGYMQGASLMLNFINDILKKMTVTGHTLDLASLFQGSPTFMRVLDTFFRLQPDPVTAMVAVQLKQSKSLEFAQLVSNPANLAGVFCDESKFRHYFTVAPSFNLTMLLDTLCNISFDAIKTELDTNFMVTALIQKFQNLSSSTFDLQKYIGAYQELNTKIMELAGVRNVTFGDLDLRKVFDINITALIKTSAFMTESLWKDYPEYLTNIYQTLLMTLNGTNTQAVRVALKTFDLFLKYLNENLQAIAGKPLNLALLMNDTEIGKVLLPLLTDQKLVDQLLNLHILPNKLQHLLSWPNASVALCSDALWDIFAATNETTALKYLQTELCSLNSTLQTWQTIAKNIHGYQFVHQMQALWKELQNGMSSMAFNTSELTKDLTTTIDLVTAVLKSFMNGTLNGNNMLNMGGFKNLIDGFKGTLGQKLMQISQKLATDLGMVVWPTMPSQEIADTMARVINTINVFMNLTNEKLQEFKDGKLGMQTLVGHSSSLMSLMEAYLNVTKYGLQAWMDGQINIVKMVDALEGPGTLTGMCKTGGLAAYISNVSPPSMVTKNLETVICTFVTGLPVEFQGITELTNVQKQLVEIWNSSGPVQPELAAYTANVNRYNQLLTQIAHMNIKMSSKLHNMLDFSNLLKSLTNLGKNPSLIFSMLKPLGLFLEAPLHMPIVGEVFGTLDSMVIYPVTRYLEMMQENGLSFASLMSNPSQLMEMVMKMSSFGTHMSIVADSYARPVFNVISKDKDFVQNVLCHSSVLKNYLKPIAFEQDMMSKMTAIFCDDDASTWVPKLTKAGIQSVEMYGIALKLSTARRVFSLCYVDCSMPMCCANPLPAMEKGFTWVQMMSDIEKMTNLIMTGTKPGAGTNGTNSAMSKFTDIKFVIDQFWQFFIGNNKIFDLLPMVFPKRETYREAMSFLETSMSYFNKMLERATNSSKQIHLSDIFPDSKEVAKLLTEMVGQDSAAEFLTAAVNWKSFFGDFLNPSSWNTVICDPVEFASTFSFPNGTDVAAIQQSFCESVQNQSSRIQELIDLFGAGNVLTQLNKLLNPSQHSPYDWFMWDRLYNTTYRLMNNLDMLIKGNVNGTSVLQWFHPILTSLQELQSPQHSLERSEKMCNQLITFMGNTEFYQSMEPTIVKAVSYIKIITDQLSIYGVMDDVVCGLAKDMNLTGVIDILKGVGFWNVFTESNNLINYNSSQELQCSDMLEASKELWMTVNNTFVNGKMLNWERMGQCMKDGASNFRSVLAGLSTALNLASDVTVLLQDPTFRELLGNQADLAPILDLIFRVFSQQRVLLKFADLIKNDSSVETYLLQALQLSPELIRSLLQSTINLDGMTFLQKPVDEIREIICDPDKLKDVLTLPEFATLDSIDIKSLSRLLCTNSSTDVAAILKGAAEAGYVIEQMLAASQTGLNQAFFNNISSHVLDLVQSVQSVSEIMAIFGNGFNVDALRENIPKIDRFLMSSGPERIVQSLTNILEDIRRVVPPGSLADTILQELVIYIRGLKGLDFVQAFFLRSLTVVDFLKNPLQVYNYLVETVGMSPENAKLVLEGTFSLRMFINSTYLLENGVNCGDFFSQLIVLNTTEFTVQKMTDNLCRVNESTAIEIANLLIPRLSIGDLLKRYVTLSLDDIFKKFNMTKDEALDVAEKLANAQKDLLKAADILTGKSVLLNLKSRELLDNIINLPQAQTAGNPESLGNIQPLLCGIKPGTLAVDEFKVETVLGSSSKITVDEEEMKELAQADKANGGDFCRKMYMDIKARPAGSIIWAYLKPIMRGKIIFTPDTPLTRQIIGQADSVFSTMKEVETVARSWADGAPRLMALSDKAKQMGDLKKVLKNEFVSDMLRRTAGLDSSNLLTGLDALSSGDFNSSSVRGMKTAADLVLNYTSCMEMDRFIPAASESDLEKLAFNLSKTNHFLAGVVFTNLMGNSEETRRKRQSDETIPHHIEYKIRMEAENVQLTSRLKDRIWSPDPESNFASDLVYFRGFIQLQDMIDRSIIALQTGDNTTLPGAYLKQFPFPCHKKDNYILVLGTYLLPVVMTFAWIAALAIATRNIVYDREYGQEETMKIMGMKPFLNWLAWFLSTMLLMFFVSGILVIILIFSQIFRYSAASILLLYLICFCLSTTMLCYMVSAFFTRTTLAILMVLIVYFISYLPYVLLVALEVQMAFWHKILACLSSTSAFGFAAQYLARFEGQNIGIHWYNIDTSPIAGDEMTFSWTCYMMLIDSGIYLLIGWYIRNVMPGTFGVSQPWYFPFSPSYWCPKRKRGIEARGRPENILLYEAPTRGNGTPGMAVRNLTKKYGKKQVVNSISCDFYEGQVTALLGHNGAAKTTTMNMLIGLLEPTSGEVFINHKGGKGSVGFCPQQNSILKYLTVMEHMELYAGFKCDWSSKQKSMEIKALLNDVDLYHVRNVRCGNLSGGMQRRLCVALAFVGGSTAVILDEPTSGVDPHARRHIWNLIIKQRLDRTVLISTHHLDEADTVGDSVAIMHTGSVLCCGSPMFLKEKLGGGYHLTVDKALREEASEKGNSSDCDSKQVLTFINTMLPRAQLVEEVGTEITYNLPREDASRTPFSTFFAELDRNASQLQIDSYGISNTTLEDVFMKVTSLADEGKPLTEEVLETERLKMSRPRSGTDTGESDTSSQGSSQETSVNMPNSGHKRNEGATLKLQQMAALLIKRFHHFRRDWRMLLSILVLPVLLFLVSMGFAQIRPNTDLMPSLLMTPSLYGPQNYMFVKDLSHELLSDKMAATLVQNPGIGSACMKGFDSGLPVKCDYAQRNYSARISPKNKNGACKCVNNKHICDPDSIVIPRQIQTIDGNYLQDLMGENIAMYLLNSYEDFTEKRYGGWSYERGPQGTDTEMATTIWYNNRGYHAIPAFFSGFSNSLLRAKMGEVLGKNSSYYGISTYNHPVTTHTMKLAINNMGSHAADTGISLVLLLAFTFIASACVVYIVTERSSKEKQLQFISGVGPVLYWTSAYLWDLFIYTITVALAVAVLAIFKIGPYWDQLNLAGTVVLLLLFGWAALPMMYMTLKWFKTASSAYLILFCLNMMIGLLTMITVLSLLMFDSMGMPGMSTALRVCRIIFLIFPQYCMGQGLIDLATNYFKYVLFSRFGEDVYMSPFSLELIGWNMVAMAVQGIVFFCVALFIDSRHGMGAKIPSRLLEIPDEDDDVHRERLRIQNGQTKDDILYVNGLTKLYRRGIRKFLAVDNISFGISKGECFGLLGVNGAGKTTTFRMLTGDSSPSAGEAYLNKHKICTGNAHIGQEVGYCPQDDALDGYLTGRELLYCHARLKGMICEDSDRAIEDLIAKLQLGKYADKATHTYSGGTKRKLSLAIAMLGEPPVLFLDEPTTGMDPATRRLVWKCITKAVNNGQSIILTSHSMNECDALSSRIGIMVNGRLMCIGSPQHLKYKFGDGYTITMHVDGLSSNRYALEQMFLSRFPGAEVKVSVEGKDQSESVLEVTVPRNVTSVAELFAMLQAAQEQRQVSRYSLSQTTLDTVFVNFARDQSDSMSENDGGSTSGAETTSEQFLAGPFTNQTYAYMNPQFSVDPSDVHLSSSQYAANLAQAATMETLNEKPKSVFSKGSSSAPEASTTGVASEMSTLGGGHSNEAFKPEEEVYCTRL